MKIAFTYDRINKFGGAERVLLALHQAYPQAPFYTSVYQPKTTSWAKDLKIKPSFLNHFPLAKNFHELYPFLTPIAFESFNFDRYDVVVSITSAEAKAIITKPHTLHLCYCLTPTRYLWSHADFYQKYPGLGKISKLSQIVFKALKPYLQKTDLIYSSHPDKYIAISKTVQKRIKKYYQQDSLLIYPPVETSKFSYAPSQDYFLLVSRLVSYKQVDLAIKAFNQLQLPLVIVGHGRQEKKLKALAGKTIKFIPSPSDLELVKLYRHCQALIMPQDEDFGIVSLEAQASGKPVISFKRGGASETIINHQTGLFFDQPTVDSLVATVKQFITCSWDKDVIQTQAKKFDTKVFVNQFKKTVEDQWKNHQKHMK